MLRRLQERFVLVRNPMNSRQISRVSLEPELVDGIVFWTKNPEPMLDKLHRMKDYAYCFQFTLNPYGRDIEPKLPRKNALVDAFKRLSDATCPRNVVWRYDPVLLSARYTAEYHIDRFHELAGALKGHTLKATFSFIDVYKKLAERLRAAGVREPGVAEKHVVAGHFSKAAQENGLVLDACAEGIDLSIYGIAPARCVDDGLIARITGRDLVVKKDKNQRRECGCVQSVDIGAYDSCAHGCAYCYANHDDGLVQKRIATHEPLSPLLLGDKNAGDTVTERRVAGGLHCAE